MSDIMNSIREKVEELADFPCEVKIQKQEKNNGTFYNALVIQEEGKKIVPIIPLDKYVKKIEKEIMTLTGAARMILIDYKKAIAEEKIPKEFLDMDKNGVLNMVTYKVVNASKNLKLMETCPHKMFLDLLVVYKMSYEKNGKFGSAIIQNELCKVYNISQEELEEAALRNTKENEGFHVLSANQVQAYFAGLEVEADENEPMYMMGNQSGAHGANIILYKEYFEKLAEKLNDDLYVFPSSVHELVAVPASIMNESEARRIVQEVNEAEVAAEEWLSDNAYLFDRKSQELTIV